MGKRKIFRLIDVKKNNEEPRTPDRKKVDIVDFDHLEIKNRYTHLLTKYADNTSNSSKQDHNRTPDTADKTAQKPKPIDSTSKVIYKDDLELEKKKKKKKGFFKRVYKILDYSCITPRQRKSQRKRRVRGMTSWDQIDSGFVYYLTGKYDLLRNK